MLLKLVIAVLVFNIVVSLSGCMSNSKVRTPLANFVLLADVHCEDIANFISTRLEAAAFNFRWVDRESKLLMVGPIITKQESENPFIAVRETYYLTIVCLSELSIKISGDAIFEGLNPDDEWVEIVDPMLTEEHSIRFLKTLSI